MTHTAETDPPNASWMAPTPEQLAIMCRRAFGPAARMASVRPLHGGTVNAVFLVELLDGTRTVLRIAPPTAHQTDADGTLLMRREYQAQPFLAAIAHLMPRTVLCDFTHDIIARDYVFQTYIEGEPWDHVADELSSEEQAHLWQQFGTLLKTIHATTGDAFGWPYPDQQFATWSETVLERFRRTRRTLVNHHLDVADFDAAFDMVRTNAALLDEVRTPRLLHGDLWTYNVLVHRTGSNMDIAGVLDADRAWWGDPLADWTMFLWSKGDGAQMHRARTAFWSAYGQPEETMQVRFRMAVYEAMHAGSVLLWAALHQPESVTRAQQEVREARTELSRMLHELSRGHGTLDVVGMPPGHWSVSEITTWIATVLPDAIQIHGPTHIHNEKPWGVTLEFAVSDSMDDDDSVVFKACELPLFAHRVHAEALLTRYCPAEVPELLAWMEPSPGQTWTLHRFFNGQNVADRGKLSGLAEMARTLARIQTTLAALPAELMEPLPRTAIAEIPDMLAHLMDVTADIYLDAWCANDESLLRRFNLPLDILDWMAYFHPHVEQWAAELAQGDWPLSIDHLDFNPSNAAVRADGCMVIFDWEETVMGCPFFSIDRLLHDADAFTLDVVVGDGAVGDEAWMESEIGLTPNQLVVRNVYIDALPWHTHAARAHAFDVAMCLAPIKTAYEGELFNAAIGREQGFPEHAARCLEQALARWQAISGLTEG